MSYIHYIKTNGKQIIKKYDEDTVEVDLINSKISEIIEIKGLERLQLLDLSCNKITEIKGLECLSQLKVLYLHDNFITKIKGLDKCVQLQSLYLYRNYITEIEGLENLTQLKELYLSHNNITKIKGLERLTQLEILYLANNLITEIEGLEGLTQLFRLKISQNQIDEIPLLITNCIMLEDLQYDANVKVNPVIQSFLNNNYANLEYNELIYRIIQRVQTKKQNTIAEILYDDTLTDLTEKLSISI